MHQDELFWNIFVSLINEINISISDFYNSNTHTHTLTPQISLTFSYHLSLSSIHYYWLWTSRLYPVFVHSWCKSLLIGKYWHIYVHKTIIEYHLGICLCFSISTLQVLFVLLEKFEMGGRWPYSCCFVESCFQDLLKTACSILV